MAKGQENGITILLGLEGDHVGWVREENEGVSCPNCGSTRLYRHGSCRLRRVLHSWSNGKKVYLELYRQRWRCRECGRSFNDGAELLRPYSRITRQAETEVLWQLKDRSFSQ